MNTADILECGLVAGEVVDLKSHFQGEVRIARQFIVVDYDIPVGCCATYFPETYLLVPIGSKAGGTTHLAPSS
jgi:hypothetical protein